MLQNPPLKVNSFLGDVGQQSWISATLGSVHRRINMMQKLRVKLARWILGKHCPCYQMGYHPMVDFQQRSADQLEKAIKAKAANT